jgi:hypothetical protein
MQQHSDGALRLSPWSPRPLRKRLELIRLEDESLDTTPRAIVTTAIPWRAVLATVSRQASSCCGARVPDTPFMHSPLRCARAALPLCGVRASPIPEVSSTGGFDKEEEPCARFPHTRINEQHCYAS